MKEILGGKGANLAEMCSLGIPVPPGFTLPTTLCTSFFDEPNIMEEKVRPAVEAGIKHIEAVMNGPRFGDPERPLLVSCRSGARDSMPGMMDTVLNIGLTDTTVEGLAKWSNNRRFALDSYRRLIQMFGDVVKGVDRAKLDEPLEHLKKSKGVQFDSELEAGDLEKLVSELKAVYAKEVGSPFPQDPKEQVLQAVQAVFGSWNGRRAVKYRELHGIPHDWGTAANVQTMVFGNFGDTSATGVAFSRDPSTGARRPMGEWLPNAQGEDVVAGIRTPGPLAEADLDDITKAVGSLEKRLPACYKDFLEVMERLEKHYADIQDVEFTIQDGVLYLLQCRIGKRTASAALRAAVEMESEGLIDRKTAVTRVTPAQLDMLMHPQIDPKATKDLLGKGLPASPGAASGTIVLDSDEAEALAKKGQQVILVRRETSPEDVGGMHASKGILTETGGMTSHAAVVARGMGRPCICGCGDLSIDSKAGTVTFKTAGGKKTLKVGESITLDGSKGEVYAGTVPTVQADLGGDFSKFLAWADEYRKLGVRTNADTPEDSQKAVELGAEGIGLCRTEHMFFAPERIQAVREMILAEDETARRKALAKIEPMQREDFEGIFKAMDGKPVTIRFLDPPLHEFLPHTSEEIAELAKGLGVDADVLERKNQALKEFNPMLGHRGCRLGLVYPEIYETQTRAVIAAACNVAKAGVDVRPEIMIPLVMHKEELKRLRELVVKVADEVFAEKGRKVEYLIGTMIELPRAALTADEVAEYADFFSFGTNDLTQTTLGLSRDDSGRFLPFYQEEGVLPHDPFASLDTAGVGKLVDMACNLGRKAKSGIKLGICGEHGGDPASIEFCGKVGLNYVSCSPFRVPIARLAAAQYAIKNS
jgi:pyruvate,orthophosphate dikinase